MSCLRQTNSVNLRQLKRMNRLKETPDTPLGRRSKIQQNALGTSESDSIIHTLWKKCFIYCKHRFQL